MNERIKILNDAKAFAQKAKQAEKTGVKITLNQLFFYSESIGNTFNRIIIPRQSVIFPV